MKNPWGFEELPRDKQLDLLAYWRIQKEISPARWMLSNPATLRDAYDILLTHHGKAPRQLFDQTDQRELHKKSQMMKAWGESNGSSQEAIRWWMTD